MSKSRKGYTAAALLVTVAAVTTACSGAAGSKSTSSTPLSHAAASAQSDASESANAPLSASAAAECAGVSAADCAAWQAIQFRPLPSWLKLPAADTLQPEGQLNGVPDGTGDKPAWYTSLHVTPQQVAQIRSKHYTAAFLDWSDAVYNKAVENGIRHDLSALNIKLVAVTNWNFDTGQLQRQLGNVLQLHPDMIITGGTLSPQQAPQILEPAVKQGVKIVLLSEGATQWKAGNEYVTFVSYPTELLGESIADAVHQAYPNGANIGMIYWNTNVAIVEQRDAGFLNGLKKYPNLKLVAKSPMADPNKAGSIASAMLLKNQDLDLIYAPWDSPPGDAVAAAIKASGNTRTKMVSLDIGNTGAAGIKSGEVVLEESGEDIYDWGTTGALAGAMSLAGFGSSVPPFMVTPVFACTKANLQSCWDFMHGPGLPMP